MLIYRFRQFFTDRSLFGRVFPELLGKNRLVLFVQNITIIDDNDIFIELQEIECMFVSNVNRIISF